MYKICVKNCKKCVNITKKLQNCVKLKKLLTTSAHMCYSKISIESVRGTAPLTTQQPAKRQGAKG